MKIAVIGATGNAGSRIVTELAARGHDVTAIARDVSKVPVNPKIAARKGDIADPDALADLLRGHDAVVSSVHFLDASADALLPIVRSSGVKRYLVVGGAASLEVAPGKILLNDPGFPEAYRAEATAGGQFLDALRGVTDLDWTFLSPPAVFAPGERTGTFRVGRDQLIANASGSSISMEDYAIALSDEIERPDHIRQRFTVGY